MVVGFLKRLALAFGFGGPHQIVMHAQRGLFNALGQHKALVFWKFLGVIEYPGDGLKALQK